MKKVIKGSFRIMTVKICKFKKKSCDKSYSNLDKEGTDKTD